MKPRQVWAKLRENVAVPDRQTMWRKARKLGWATIVVVSLALGIQLVRFGMLKSGLTIERFLAWTAASNDHAMFAAQLLVIVGVGIFIIRHFHQKYFGLFEIGAGGGTLYALLQEQRQVLLQACAVLGALFVVVRGVGNVWDGITMEVAEKRATEANDRVPSKVET